MNLWGVCQKLLYKETFGNKNVLYILLQMTFSNHCKWICNHFGNVFFIILKDSYWHIKAVQYMQNMCSGN